MEIARMSSYARAMHRHVAPSRARAAEHVADTPHNSALLGLMRRGASQGVRFHTSGRAADAAEALHAKAFTVGHDVAFAPGRFAPETSEGKSLIAHELTHVAQQEVEGPRLQFDVEEGEELEPGYLRGMDASIRDHIARRVKLFAEAGTDVEIGPVETLRSKFGIMPWAENAEIEIPQRDYEPFQWVLESEGGKPKPRTYRLHQRLPGGFELVDVGNKRVLLEYHGTGLVIPDWLFAEMFEGYQELQEPVIYQHEHPGRVLLANIGISMIPLPIDPQHAMGLMAMVMFPFLPGFARFGAVPESGLLMSEGEAALGGAEVPELASILEGETPFEPWEEPTLVDAPYGATRIPETVSFASNEAWYYDGRVIRVVNTPEGARAFYQRTGEGGEFFMGAQPGDWVPFDGFQADPGGAIFVKPEGTFEPSTPLTEYRWGTEQNRAISEWIQSQPEPTPVDVGEAWGLIQRRLEELGVPVRYPMAGFEED